jgi:hypothetical protein
LLLLLLLLLLGLLLGLHHSCFLLLQCLLVILVLFCTCWPAGLHAAKPSLLLPLLLLTHF